MYKIIGGDQREYGPVSADELRRWIAEGRLNAHSLARSENTTEWKPLSAFPEFAEALNSVHGSQPTAGVQPPPPIAPEIWATEILGRQPQVNLSDCLSRSWQLMTKDFGLLFSSCLVVWLIGFCQFIPFISLVYRVMAGVFYGGLYLIFLKRIRGQSAAVGDVFAGFNLAFGQLVLAGFLSWLLAALALCCCFLLPGVYLFVAWVFSVPLVIDKRVEFWTAMELSRKMVTKVWFEIFALILISFLPVIAAGLFVGVKVGFSFFPTIQHMTTGGPPDIARLMNMILQLDRTRFGLSFFYRLVLLINIPFAVGALMYAYENLFGPRTSGNT
jgi:hypothetical protein